MALEDQFRMVSGASRKVRKWTLGLGIGNDLLID